jgi:hypothetical protein
MQLDFSVSLSPIDPVVGPNRIKPKIYNTLLVDKNHRTPAAAQASSNIVRCTLAAIAVSFLQDMIDAMGIGWTFTFMGGLCVVALGLFFVDYHRGTSWGQRSIDSLSHPGTRADIA